MKNLKFLCIALCLLLLATLFVACNDDSESETTPDTQAITSEATEAVADGTQASTQGTETSALVETSVETENQTTSETQVETLAETQAETTAQDIPFSTEVANVYYNMADLNGLYVVRSEVNSKGMLLREAYLDLMSNMMHPLSTLSYIYDDEGNLTAMVYTDMFYCDRGTIYLTAAGKEVDGSSYVELHENGLLKERSITVDGQTWLCEYDELGRRTHELYEDFDSVWVYEGDSFHAIRYELEDIGEGKSFFDLTYENGQLTGINLEVNGQTGTYNVGYDVNGYVGSFGITYQGQFGIMTQFTWNDKGQFTEITSGGTTYTFEYDANGNNTKITLSRKSGETTRIPEVYTYTYENNLKVSGRRDTYKEDGTLDYYNTYEWTYNDKGDMTSYTSSWIIEREDRTSVQVTTEEYKPNGSMFRKTHINYVDGDAHEKTVREYEDGLCVIECRYFAHKGDADQEATYYMTEKVESEYNDNRRVSKVTTTRYNEAGEVTGKTVRVYTYDADGNQSYTETKYDANNNVIE